MRMFDRPDICQAFNRGGSSYYYKDYAVRNADPCDHMDIKDLTIPNVFESEVDNDQFVLAFPTRHLLNEEEFEASFNIDVENNSLKMMVGEKFIIPMEKYGFYSPIIRDNILLLALKRIVDHISFCEGLDIKIPENVRSIVLVRHNWSKWDVNGTISNWSAFHSHQCTYLMPFTSEIGNKTCRECVHDLR